jgi:hypothetical protein
MPTAHNDGLAMPLYVGARLAGDPRWSLIAGRRLYRGRRVAGKSGSYNGRLRTLLL